MSRLFHFAIVAAMMALPAVAMGGDTEIAQSIVKQLQAKKAEGSLKGFNIGLRVEEGVVWLEGHVSNAEQHDMAVDVARRVSGVQRVVDGIRIEGRSETAAPAATPVAEPRDLAAAELKKPQETTAEEAPASRFVAQQAPQDAVPSEAEPQVPEPRRMEVVAQQAPVQQPSVQQVPAQQEMAFEAEEEFSFSPVRAASAEKPATEETAAADPAPAMRPLRPVPVAPQGRPIQAAQVPYAMGHGHPAYRMASNANRGAMAHQPVAIAAAPAYYPSQYGYGYGYGGPARYDQPHMPGYAWPAYAAHPNYAAVTYPRQYSPMAWPYIGPFYPYPQVPLGWRSVTMEWEDGWWTLDFKARRHNSF